MKSGIFSCLMLLSKINTIINFLDGRVLFINFVIDQIFYFFVFNPVE